MYINGSICLLDVPNPAKSSFKTIYVCSINRFGFQLTFQQSEMFSSKCADIFQRFPSIEVCKNDKFERALTNQSMTMESKNYFIGEMVKTIASIDAELRSVNSSMQTSLNDEDVIIFSPKVIQVKITREKSS